jgi:hypothetical protein
MKTRNWIFGATLGIGLSLAFVTVPGGSRLDVAAGALPLFSRTTSGDVAFDRRAILARIRQDLGLATASQVALSHLPPTVRGPKEGPLSVVLTREADEGSGRYLYLLDLIENGVARESFYLNVRVRQAGEARSTGGETASSVLSVEGDADGSRSIVKAGDTVHVTARGEGFLIRFSGIAQGDGSLGEVVPVVNPVSGTSLSGRVTGHDRVVVALGGGRS